MRTAGALSSSSSPASAAWSSLSEGRSQVPKEKTWTLWRSHSDALASEWRTGPPPGLQFGEVETVTLVRRERLDEVEAELRFERGEATRFQDERDEAEDLAELAVKREAAKLAAFEEAMTSSEAVKRLAGELFYEDRRRLGFPGDRLERAGNDTQRTYTARAKQHLTALLAAAHTQVKESR
jgi:hypothetical protein